MYKFETSLAAYTLAACLLVGSAGVASRAEPLGSGFTLQGQLKQGGSPLNDTADFEFTLWDADVDGNQIGGVVAIDNITVVDGLFTVTLNTGGEFGPDALNGEARHVEVSVRSPAGGGIFTTLAPRQPMTGAPYALKVPGVDGHSLDAADGDPVDALFVDNDGYVGIGTTPEHRFHLSGDMRVEGRVAMGNDAYFGVGGGAYPEYDRLYDFSHVVTDFSSSPFWSHILAVFTLDPDSDFSGSQVYASSFEVHTAEKSNEDMPFLAGLTGGGVHKGTGTISNLFGGFMFSGPRGSGTVTNNFGLLAGASVGFGSTGSIIDNIGITIGTGHLGDGGSIGTDIGLRIQTPYNDQPIDTHYGIYLADQNVAQTTNYAIYSEGGDVFFNGDLDVTGTLSKGGGSFKIDHPLDPENKYLYHSFVESPDMMNIYNGIVTTNDNGYADIVLPEWFEVLNRDFRYQLTVIDAADSDEFVQVKVVSEIDGNRFAIRSSAPQARVSWQVTGIRHDPWAEANRIQVEVEKSQQDRGKYQHPALFGKPLDQTIGYHAQPELVPSRFGGMAGRPQPKRVESENR